MEIFSQFGLVLLGGCCISCSALMILIIMGILFGFGIVEIVIGHAEIGCDVANPTFNLTVGQWLIGLGVFTLIGVIYGLYSIKTGREHIFYNVISSLFSIIWLFIGAIVIFVSNVVCIVPNAITVKYGLAMWCIQLLLFLWSFHEIINRFYYRYEIEKEKRKKQQDPENNVSGSNDVKSDTTV